MLSRTVSLYKQAYSGLSPETWWLSLVMLINRSGTMVIPFMTIYLTSPQMGYSIEKAGIVMGLFGLGAVIGAHLSGKITDRIGFYPVQLFTLIVGGVLFIILGQMKAYPLICLFTFLLSFVNEAFRPANSTAIAFYSKPENRTRSYSLNRLAINLGWAFGNAIGGWVATVNYEALFWLDGITNIAAGILMWVLLRPANSGKHPAKKEATASNDSVYRDRNYLFFVILVVLFASCFFQLFTNLPAYYRNELHFPQTFIGWIGAVNGLIIAFFEMVLVYKMEGRRSSVFYIIRGVLVCALAYGLLQFAGFDHYWALFMILMMTAGEILAMPFLNSFWISRSASHNRGQYAALYTIAWATAQTIGPALAAQLAGKAGFTTLWAVVALILLLTAGGFVYLQQLIRKEKR